MLTNRSPRIIHKVLGFRFVTEKSLNLTKLHGEQDSRNKISYTKWARQIKDFSESKGADGKALSKP